MDAENGAIIIAENHGGQVGGLMTEETIEAEHEGALMHQFFIHALKFEWYAQIGQGVDDVACQAVERVAKDLYQFGLHTEEELC